MPDDNRFLTAREKLTIASLDDPMLEVAAQYNPKDLDISRAVSWKPTNSDNGAGAPHKEPARSDAEFLGGQGRSLSLELLFDGYETNRSIEPVLRDLDELASIIDPESHDDDLLRPHQCVLVWGSHTRGIRPIICVIESIAVKYTVFASDGRPLRAVATIKVKEASVSEKTKQRAATRHRPKWSTDDVELRRIKYRTPSPAPAASPGTAPATSHQIVAKIEARLDARLQANIKHRRGK